MEEWEIPSMSDPTGTRNVIPVTEDEEEYVILTHQPWNEMISIKLQVHAFLLLKSKVHESLYVHLGDSSNAFTAWATYSTSTLRCRLSGDFGSLYKVLQARIAKRRGWSPDELGEEGTADCGWRGQRGRGRGYLGIRIVDALSQGCILDVRVGALPDLQLLLPRGWHGQSQHAAVLERRTRFSQPSHPLYVSSKRTTKAAGSSHSPILQLQWRKVVVLSAVPLLKGKNSLFLMFLICMNHRNSYINRKKHKLCVPSIEDVYNIEV